MNFHLSCFESKSGLGWVGVDGNLCGHLLYEHRCANKGCWKDSGPASRQVYSVPRSRRKRSQKARQSCSLKLVGWMTGTGSPWKLGIPKSFDLLEYFPILQKQWAPETLSRLRPNFLESGELSCGLSRAAHNWHAWFEVQQPEDMFWDVILSMHDVYLFS